ncbi:MAG: DoxX family protein [Candidatus Poribacteria bacterium]|nr:DoxX family protein [Candidatus Poribacteria bacterium]
MYSSRMDRVRDVGLLALRVGLGAMFMKHGYGKITGGVERWERLGGAMENVFGIGFAPVLWGFMAAFSEFFGGLMLMVGIAFRPAAGLLAFTMLVAGLNHLKRGDGFNTASHALEACVIFTSLILIGGGRFSVDAVLFRNRRPS